MDHLFSLSNALRILGMALQNKAFTGPLKITMDITDTCDMGCVMCWYHSPYLPVKNGDVETLSLEKFSSLAEEFKKMGVKTVMFTGKGEPLLHPDILEIIEEARKNRLDVEIMTNAYYLDKEKIKFLAEARVKKIIVSLHCADIVTFRKMRPLKNENDFKKITDNLSALKEMRRASKKPLLYITNVITRFNYTNVERMAELAEKIKADKVLFKPLIFPPGAEKELMLRKEHKKELINCFKDIAAKINIPHNITSYIKMLKYNRETVGKRNRPVQTSTRFQKCYMPWAHSVIRMDGEVAGCVYASGKSQGNIYQSSFADIWYGEKYNLFRKGGLCPRKCLGKAVYPLLFS